MTTRSHTEATKGNDTAKPVKTKDTTYLKELPMFVGLSFELKDTMVCAIHNHSRGGHAYPTVGNIGQFGALFLARLLKKNAGNGIVKESDRVALADDIKRQVNELFKTV